MSRHEQKPRNQRHERTLAVHIQGQASKAKYRPRDVGGPGILPLVKDFAPLGIRRPRTGRAFALGFLVAVGLLVVPGCGVRGGNSDPTDSSDANRAVSEIEEFARSLDDPVANAKEHESGDFLKWPIGAEVWGSTGHGTGCVGAGRLKDIREGTNVALVGLVKDSTHTWDPIWKTTLGRGRTRTDDGKKYCAFPVNLPALTPYDNLHYTNFLIQVDQLERVGWDAVSWYRATPQPEPTPVFTQPNDGITSGEDLLNAPLVPGG